MIANDVQQIINEELSTDKYGYDVQTFIYSVPENVRNDNKITVLIQDMPNKPVTYGSNQFKQLDYHITIQVYFPYAYAKDYDDIGFQLIDILQDNGWYFITSHVASDPETDRAFSVFDFHKYYNK